MSEAPRAQPNWLDRDLSASDDSRSAGPTSLRSPPMTLFSLTLLLGLLFPVLLAVEEITKHVYAEVAEATPENAAAFLVNLVAQSPEKIIAVITDMAGIRRLERGVQRRHGLGRSSSLRRRLPRPRDRPHPVAPNSYEAPENSLPSPRNSIPGGPSNRSVGLRQSGAGLAAVSKTPWGHPFVAPDPRMARSASKPVPDAKHRWKRRAKRRPWGCSVALLLALYCPQIQCLARP